MKREKLTVSIEVSMNDEAGDLAGEMRAGEEQTVSACGEHIADAVDLQARLQSAYQHWLAADDATLTDACEQGLEIAASDPHVVTVRNRSSHNLTLTPCVQDGNPVVVVTDGDSDDDRYDGIARAMKGISADDMATGLDRMSEHMGKAAERNDPRTEKLGFGAHVGERRRWLGHHKEDGPFTIVELAELNEGACGWVFVCDYERAGVPARMNHEVRYLLANSTPVTEPASDEVADADGKEASDDE